MTNQFIGTKVTDTIDAFPRKHSTIATWRVKLSWKASLGQVSLLVSQGTAVIWYMMSSTYARTHISTVQPLHNVHGTLLFATCMRK